MSGLRHLRMAASEATRVGNSTFPRRSRFEASLGLLTAPKTMATALRPTLLPLRTCSSHRPQVTLRGAALNEHRKRQAGRVTFLMPLEQFVWRPLSARWQAHRQHKALSRMSLAIWPADAAKSTADATAAVAAAIVTFGATHAMAMAAVATMTFTEVAGQPARRNTFETTLLILSRIFERLL